MIIGYSLKLDIVIQEAQAEMAGMPSAAMRRGQVFYSLSIRMLNYQIHDIHLTRLELGAGIVYVKNVGIWAMWKVPNKIT